VLKWLAGLTLVTVILLVALAPHWVLPPLARWLDVSEAPRPVDYVLVLNGDPETRPFAAAALVRVGLARQVLLTPQRLTLESGSVREGAVLSELQITQGILKARGVPDTAVRVLPAEIGSTFDEAAALADFFQSQPDATVAVVTNGFHTRRSRRVFRRQLGDLAARVFFVGVPRDGVDEKTWWRTPQGCVVYASEYAKLLYYGIRY
jgi:uncharacterized SAM-binding protein YcdF (DUF218 family)